MPFLPALIGGGASIIGGLLGGRRSKEEKAALQSQSRLSAVEEEAARKRMGLMDVARGRMEQITPFTQRFLSKGEGAMGNALGYWNRILSGRDSATSLLSPEINRITEGYRGARTASRELNPRGGGVTSMTRRIDESIVPGQITGLLNRARPAAAGQVGSIGSSLSNTALGLGGLETNLLQTGFGPTGAEGTSGSLLNYGLNRSAQQYDYGSGIGRTIFDIMKGFSMGKTGGMGRPQLNPGAQAPNSGGYGGKWGFMR